MKKLTLTIFTLALALTVVLPSRAHAQFGVPISTLADTYSVMSNKKDFGLDQLAYIAAKRILHEMTASTIRWINSGFQGNPSFITNPQAFFLDAADQATGEFLAKNGATNQLCSPWSNEIRLVLALEQAQTNFYGVDNRRYYCTLGRIINNAQNASINGYSIKGFIDGDFKQGGWPAFIAIATEPQNSPSGAYLMAQSDMLAVIGAKKSAVNAELVAGRGFLNYKKCETVNEQYQGGGDEGYDGEGDVQQREVCKTVTPGSVIADTLQQQLGVPANELLLADDINAVINALMSQLINQMLSNGLATLSSGGGSSNRTSYTRQIISDANAARSVTLGTVGISQSLVDIQDKYTQSVSVLDDAQTKLDTARGCYVAYEQNHNNTVLSQISIIDNASSLEIGTLRTELNGKLEAVKTRIATASSANTITLPQSNDLSITSTYVDQQVAAYQSQVNSSMSQTVDLTTATKIAGDDYGNAVRVSKNVGDRADELLKQCRNMPQ